MPMVGSACMGRAWYNDTAAAALHPVTRGARFNIGGDRTPHSCSTPLPGDRSGQRRVLRSPATAGRHHALRKFTHGEVGTFLDPRADAYELDHLFIVSEFHAALTDCHVIADPASPSLSDHAPLVAEFASGEVLAITADPESNAHAPVGEAGEAVGPARAFSTRLPPTRV